MESDLGADGEGRERDFGRHLKEQSAASDQVLARIAADYEAYERRIANLRLAVKVGWPMTAAMSFTGFGLGAALYRDDGPAWPIYAAVVLGLVFNAVTTVLGLRLRDQLVPAPAAAVERPDRLARLQERAEKYPAGVALSSTYAAWAAVGVTVLLGVLTLVLQLTGDG